MQKRARGRIWAKTGIFCDGTGPPGFEPGFEAPEASVMSKLYYGPAVDPTAIERAGNTVRRDSWGRVTVTVRPPKVFREGCCGEK